MFKQNKKRVISILLVLMMAFFAAACGKPEEGGEKSASKTTVTVALPAEPTTLWGSQSSNINSNNPICNIAEGLMEITPDGEYIPWLAESYDVIDDVTYRFHLKKGVKFHNGEEMKASDVVFSLKEASVSPVVTHASSGLDPEGFEIEDDYTVIIKTLGPFSPILSCLSHSANSIVSEKASKEMSKDEYGRNPVGTGPFKFVKWDSGDKIVLERFDDYHGGGKAKADELVFRFITEAASRVIELESGGVDIIGEVPMNELARLAESDEYTIYSKPGMRVYPIIFNTIVKPFNDEKVRKAIAYATDQAEIIEAVWEGQATQIYSIMPPAVMGYTEKTDHYDYDVEKAKSMLADAGYPEGLSFTLLTREDGVMVKSAEVLQAQWAKVGVNVKIEQMDAAAWSQNVGDKNFQVTISASNNSVGDPDSNFFKQFYTENAGVAGNYGSYSNKEVDDMIWQARAATDKDERIAFYEKLQQLVIEDSPWIPIAVPDLSVVTNKDIKGFDLYANNTQRYKDVYK